MSENLFWVKIKENSRCFCEITRAIIMKLWNEFKEIHSVFTRKISFHSFLSSRVVSAEFFICFPLFIAIMLSYYSNGLFHLIQIIRCKPRHISFHGAVRSHHRSWCHSTISCSNCNAPTLFVDPTWDFPSATCQLYLWKNKMKILGERNAFNSFIV